MNVLAIVITANIVATLAIFCGLKLFDIGSDFADMIKKYGVFLGIIFAFVAIFHFLIRDAVEILDINYVIWAILISTVGFSFLGFITSILKNLLLEFREKKKGKKRVPIYSAMGLCAIDLFIGIVAGAAAGICFVVNSGTGVIMLCALSLLILIRKVAIIRYYQDAKIRREVNLAILIPSLCVSPIVAILVYLWGAERYAYIGVFLATAIGYLAYICLYHLLIIVKSIKKR